MGNIASHIVNFAFIFIFGAVLASCSSGYDAFFKARDAQLKQGYTWKKLDECRPPQPNSLSIPIIGKSGADVVCYKLKPPSEQHVITDQAKPQNPTPLDSLKKSQPIYSNTSTDGTGITWDFTNF